jgi:hypothetical protein
VLMLEGDTMPVTVDHRLLAAQELGLKTVGQVLRHLRRDNRLVVHVLIDGKEPTPDRFKQIKRFPIGKHAVFIETADPKEMASNVLDKVEAQLNEADRLKNETTQLLAKKQFAPAIEKLGGCFNTWQHAQESVLKTCQLLRVNLECVQVRGRKLTDLLGEFTDQLRDIRTALEERDFATLGDILKTKTTETCVQWREAIRSLRVIIAS